MGQVVPFAPPTKKTPAPAPENHSIQPTKVFFCSLCNCNRFYLLDNGLGGVACEGCKHIISAQWRLMMPPPPR